MNARWIFFPIAKWSCARYSFISHQLVALRLQSAHCRVHRAPSVADKSWYTQLCTNQWFGKLRLMDSYTFFSSPFRCWCPRRRDLFISILVRRLLVRIFNPRPFAWQYFDWQCQTRDAEHKIWIEAHLLHVPDNNNRRQGSNASTALLEFK